MTLSPPRSSKEARESNSRLALSHFSTRTWRDRQRIEADASRHRQMVWAASHSVSRMNQPSGAPRPDLADCRQSMRANGSPETNLRNCQKLSPCPTRLRPCTPWATVEATRSAAISKGGRRAPRATAVSALSRAVKDADARRCQSLGVRHRVPAVGSGGRRAMTVGRRDAGCGRASDPWPILPTRRSITSGRMTPSARAEKLSAIRCRSTGRAERYDVVHAG